MARTSGQSLLLLRSERHMSQRELADKLGVACSTISLWEQDRRVPRREMIRKIMDYFVVDRGFLYGSSDMRLAQKLEGDFVTIPVYDIEDALHNKDREHIKDNIVLPKAFFARPTSFFAVRCPDDAMMGIGLKAGDLAIFENGIITENNRVGFFDVNGKAFIRRLVFGDGELSLVPCNDEYTVISAEGVRMIGQLAATVRCFQ